MTAQARVAGGDPSSAAEPLGWLDSADHREWLRQEERRLLRFPRPVLSPFGDASVFSAKGAPVTGVRARTFDTARIAHVHALAALRGAPGARAVASALLDHLARFADTGWPDHPLEPAAPQSLYTLSFVILAASSGLHLRHAGSEGMLRAALRRLDEVFSEPGAALAVDRVSVTGEVHPYRGLNGNMHLTEALFAAADASGDIALRQRAVRVCEFVLDVSDEFDGRICEHFDAVWRPLPEHHRDRPDHAFVPYGATVGHGIEWARLIAQAHTIEAPRFLAAAVAIFDRAVADGWWADGRPGFVYTTDWSGVPVVRDRYHWVAVEAIAAAAVLWRLTGHSSYASRYEVWLDYSAEHFIDDVGGSWFHRLDPRNRPYDEPKPDLYHAYQAMLIPQLPVRTSVAAACVAGRSGPALA